ACQAARSVAATRSVSVRAAEAMGWPFGPCVQLLILTAQRREEVARMRWHEVDLDGAVWVLPSERAKNGREHEVALAPSAVQILRGLPGRAGIDLVFTRNGRAPITSFSHAKRSLDAHILAARAPIAGGDGGDPESKPMPGWTLHDLRRTATSGMPLGCSSAGR